jgi:hypothetical protein
MVNLHGLLCAIVPEFIHIDTEVLYLNIAGQGIVVVSSQEAVDEILERRAIKNTDRPRNIMCTELLTGGLLFVFTRYNNT